MPNRNRLVDSAKLADGLLIHKNNPIHICNRHDFASTTYLFKIIIKIIKKPFQIFWRFSMSPTHQDLSNDTTFSQIKSCVPVPLRFNKCKCLQSILLACFNFLKPSNYRCHKSELFFLLGSEKRAPWQWYWTRTNWSLMCTYVTFYSVCICHMLQCVNMSYICYGIYLYHMLKFVHMSYVTVCTYIIWYSVYIYLMLHSVNRSINICVFIIYIVSLCSLLCMRYYDMY